MTTRPSLCSRSSTSTRSAAGPKSALALASLGLVLATGCRAVESAGPSVDAPSLARDARPAWLPPPTDAQRELLRPLDAPIAVVAEPTYPDLERFSYAPDRVLEDPREAMRVARLVAEIIERSPRVYELVESEERDANLVEQYGPAAASEPDPFSVALRDSSGRIRLVPLTLSEELAERHDAATRELREGRAGKARGLFEQVIAAAPGALAPRLGLVRALRALGDRAGAEAQARSLLGLDPTLATAHLALAELSFERGDLTGARLGLVHALALHPGLSAAQPLLARMSGAGPTRIRPMRIFLSVDDRGAVRVGAPKAASARMYAGCRAVLRFEPEVRSSLLDVPTDAPYFLSALEEMLCIESGVGAYAAMTIGARQRGEPEPVDETGEALLLLAKNEGLLGFVMFEVLGAARPERARVAPEFVHRALVRYVRRHVLGSASGEEQTGRFVALPPHR